MRFDQIRPFVRFARIFSPAAANCGRFVVMQDCRLFLLHSGASTIAAAMPRAQYELLDEIRRRKD